MPGDKSKISNNFVINANVLTAIMVAWTGLNSQFRTTIYWSRSGNWMVALLKQCNALPWKNIQDRTEVVVILRWSHYKVVANRSFTVC